jgi:hypothetical protein
MELGVVCEQLTGKQIFNFNTTNTNTNNNNKTDDVDSGFFKDDGKSLQDKMKESTGAAGFHDPGAAGRLHTAPVIKPWKGLRITRRPAQRYNIFAHPAMISYNAPDFNREV